LLQPLWLLQAPPPHTLLPPAATSPAGPQPPSSAPSMLGLGRGFDGSRAGWEFPEGTCAGYIGYPSDPEFTGVSKPRTYSTSSTLSTESEPEPDQAVKLSFSVAGLAGLRSQWDAVLWQNRLYVAVTQDQLLDGSKQGFISLLEYAEEELGVEHVIACLPDGACNKNIIRNFLFLGFSPLSSGHEHFPTTKPNVVCFLYTI